MDMFLVSLLRAARSWLLEGASLVRSPHRGILEGMFLECFSKPRIAPRRISQLGICIVGLGMEPAGAENRFPSDTFS